MSLPIHIVLVQPEIPHNTGAIGRLCVDLDCPLHLVRPLGFALTSAWVTRAGLDYWQHLSLHLHDNWDAFTRYMAGSPAGLASGAADAAAGVPPSELRSLEGGRPRPPGRLWFASTRGATSLYDVRFIPGDALVFGNESTGLPQSFYDTYRDKLFRIPMPGPHARSLNLANAVSVAAYEAFRQQTGSQAQTVNPVNPVFSRSDAGR